MKKIIMFATFLTLISAYAADTITKTNLKEKSYSSVSAPSPSIDFQIKHGLLVKEDLGPAYAKNPIGFCHECAIHCMRKKLVIGSCSNYLCYCSDIHIGNMRK